MQRNRSRATTDTHCYYFSEKRQHRGLSVSPRQNKPTEAKVWKKKTSTRVSPQMKWSLRFFSFYVSLFCSFRRRDGRYVLTCCRVVVQQQKQHRPFFWWSRTWCHTAYISGTGRRGKRKNRMLHNVLSSVDSSAAAAPTVDRHSFLFHNTADFLQLIIFKCPEISKILSLQSQRNKNTWRQFQTLHCRLILCSFTNKFIY